MIAFVFTFLMGFLFIKTFLYEIKSRFLLISLSLAFGIAIESLVTSILIYIGFNNLFSIAASTAALFLTSLFFALRKKISPLKKNYSSSDFILKLLFILMFIINIILLFIHILKEPQGSHDGMFIWNLHTKFFYMLSQTGQSWKLFFNDAISVYHLDYPLLLPLYNYKNQMLNVSGYSDIIPLITSILFYIAILTGTTGLIKELNNQKNALIAGIVLMSVKPFIWESSTQCADIPLSLYILLSAGGLFLYQKYQNNFYVFLSFFFAGSAAFCKNEGILFFLVFLTVVLIFLKQANKKMILLGCILPIICLLYFKIFIYSKSDLFENQNFSLIISKILDFQNTKIILLHYLNNLINLWNLVLAALIIFIKQDKPLNNITKMSFLLIFIIFISYFIIYLITPNDINWHLTTSSMRLTVQYIPLFVFLIFNEPSKSFDI